MRRILRPAVLLSAALAAACGGPAQKPLEPLPDPAPPPDNTVAAPAPKPIEPLPAPAVEVVADESVSLPAPPELALPPETDPLRPRRLRLAGSGYLDKEIAVQGTVVWKYDCARDIRKPGMSNKELRRILREEPERCTRPNLYLGDTARTAVNRSVWVVEVPRPIRADEKKFLAKEDIAAWPKVPKVKVGDTVIIRGTWATRSPRGFANSDGLLVYESLEHVK